MGYRCTLFVSNISTFTGDYADALTAARDLDSRASAYAEHTVSVPELAGYIESGSQQATIDFRLRPPQVHVEVERI